MDGVHFLITDDPIEFAEKLAVNGRKLADRFSYQRGVKKLGDILENIGKNKLVK